MIGFETGYIVQVTLKYISKQCYLGQKLEVKFVFRKIYMYDQWEYSISEVRICELIKMRKAKIFSQSEMPAAGSNLRRR